MSFFFFQAEDGIRDVAVTGVQTCALPICCLAPRAGQTRCGAGSPSPAAAPAGLRRTPARRPRGSGRSGQIGRASCRERVEISVGVVTLKKRERRKTIEEFVSCKNYAICRR